MNAQQRTELIKKFGRKALQSVGTLGQLTDGAVIGFSDENLADPSKLVYLEITYKDGSIITVVFSSELSRQIRAEEISVGEMGGFNVVDRGDLGLMVTREKGDRTIVKEKIKATAKSVGKTTEIDKWAGFSLAQLASFAGEE